MYFSQLVLCYFMHTTLIEENEEQLVIQITIPKSRDFLQCEDNIQDALNQAGCIATQKCLEQFDLDGSPIIIADQKLTAKRGKVEKKYETPYGVIRVKRFAYQSPQGGQVHLPLESNARIIAGSTPRFAKIVSFNYSHNNSAVVQANLDQSLNRKVARCYIQDISAAVAQHVDDKSSHWDYLQSEPAAYEVAYISIGLDGACMFFCEEGYRQAMVGTIAFFDAAGQRLHTNYIAAAPEHGKAIFLRRMDEAIQAIKSRHKHARFIGISDGATDFRSWLKKHTTTLILDFWHVTEYIHSSAEAIHRKKTDRDSWIDQTCHNLKHKHGAAKEILDELLIAESNNLSVRVRKELEAAISYFTNNLDRMNYASYRKSHLPIGSGITEAACKTLVKLRMCGSGMKWKSNGADQVLTLRALALSGGKWENFWENVSKFGLAKILKNNRTEASMQNYSKHN